MLLLLFFVPTLIYVEDTFAQQADQFRLRAYKYNKNFDNSDTLAEIKFGRELAARILNKYKLVDRSEQERKVTRYLAALGAGIASMIGRTEIKYYFAILDSDDVNAYACPGGYIFITKGAMKLIKDEAQLAGVLAHEIAHVNERHIIRKLQLRGSDNSVVSGFGALIAGASASYLKTFSTLLDKAMEILFEEGISKKEELQSDGEAIKTLISLGYNPNNYLFLIKSLAKVMQMERGKVLSKTHPSVTQREQEIEEIISLYNINKNQPNQPILSLKTGKKRFEKHVKF
ncbi:MAG: M48 family metalloprotease [Oligoflexia bacterium]|nr:M48 family metalloprotease [Oligoflexia bacterium]